MPSDPAVYLAATLALIPWLAAYALALVLYGRIERAVRRHLHPRRWD